MKQILLSVLLLVCSKIFSQYCGNSGLQVCTTQYYVADTANESLSTRLDSLPCIAQNMTYNESVSFRCDSVSAYVQGQYFYLSIWLEVDSIVGLPNGICWATNDSDNYVSNGWLCINFSGITAESPGNFPCVLHGYASPNNVPIIPEIDPLVIPFQLRVRDATDACVSINTGTPAISIYEQATVQFTETNALIKGSEFKTTVTFTDLAGRIINAETIAPRQSFSIDMSSYHGLLLVIVADRNSSKTYKLFR